MFKYKRQAKETKCTFTINFRIHERKANNSMAQNDNN